jgi:hypothetical protein
MGNFHPSEIIFQGVARPLNYLVTSPVHYRNVEVAVDVEISIEDTSRFQKPIITEYVFPLFFGKDEKK